MNPIMESKTYYKRNILLEIFLYAPKSSIYYDAIWKKNTLSSSITYTWDIVLQYVTIYYLPGM